MSVSAGPGDCLRHRCSSAYLRISLLHAEFHPPLPYSSYAVTKAVPRLSPGISPLSCITACARFTPSNSEQRLHPLSYRGCWHRVSRCLLRRYRHRRRYLLRLIRLSPQSFTTRRPSSLTRRRCVRLSSIAQDSLLLPPVGVWSVSQYQCGGTSSQTPY